MFLAIAVDNLADIEQGASNEAGADDEEGGEAGDTTGAAGTGEEGEAGNDGNDGENGAGESSKLVNGDEPDDERLLKESEMNGKI